MVVVVEWWQEAGHSTLSGAVMSQSSSSVDFVMLRRVVFRLGLSMGWGCFSTGSVEGLGGLIDAGSVSIWVGFTVVSLLALTNRLN